MDLSPERRASNSEAHAAVAKNATTGFLSAGVPRERNAT
jgi:hypothetical protein